MPKPTPRQLVAGGLVALAGLWLLFNERFEGPTLVVVTADHGLTVGDLPALAVGFLAAVVLVIDRR